MANSNFPDSRRARLMRRLTTDKGSVLFFVIAIMSVLIVMASALFYAVNSANKEVESRYANEQAYQSAISVNNMVSDYIAADPQAQFVNAAFALTAGDSIKTSMSDLGVGIGTVQVTITKISGDADSAILSITTESEVDGQMQTVTSVGELKEGQDPQAPATLTRFFTSTGYVPNDTLFSSGEVTSELYLDCEYTELAGQNGSTGGFDILADIISSGSVRFNNAPVNGGGAAGKKIDITIGNDCYFYYPAGLLDLGGGTLRVGGSVVQLANCYAFNKNTNVYIQGDLYSGTAMGDNAGQRILVNGNLVVADSFNYNGDIYVNGDVFLDKDFNQGIFAGKLYVGGNVYVDKNSGLKANQLTAINSFAEIKGKTIESEVPVDFNLSDTYTVYEAEDTIESIIKGNASENGGVEGYTYVWPSSSADTNPCDTMDTVTEKINEAIGSSNYINWKLDKMFHVGENENNPYIETTDIVFPFVNYQATRTVTLSAKDSDRYIIQNIDVQVDYGASALVFDTDDGSGGFKDIYVMLKPNVIYDNDNGTVKSPEFSFSYNQYIKCKNCGHTEPYTGAESNIGGIDYNQYYNWGMSYDPAAVCSECGQPITQFVGCRDILPEITTAEADLNGFKFADNVPNDGQANPNNSAPFHVFVKGKGSVIFVIPEGETFVANNQSYIGHYALYKEITGDSIEAAESSNGYKSANDGVAKLTALEADSVNFDAKLGLFKQPLIDKYGDSGEKLYLHNNIFLASVEKNVNVDFNVAETIFAGLLYAPYMQYTSTSGASNRVLFGGLVVSNYTLQGSGKYLYAAPYDYYDRFVKDEEKDDPEKLEEARNKYLANLMGTTGSNDYLEDGNKGSIGRAWNRFGYN